MTPQNTDILKMRITPVLLIFALLSALPLAAEKPASPQDDLARVGIANFTNLNSNADYEWVEQSLPDAINTSMHARFEFVRQDENKVNAAVSQAREVPGQSKGQTAQQIAMQSQSDILIFGEFTVDAEKSELVMKARVYNATGRRFIGEIEETSEINNRVFKRIDDMAAGIVSIIYQYALQANKGSSFNNLKLLVLVPSFGDEQEKAAAELELQKMKSDLAARTPGNYVTIYEFFDQYHVAPDEQKRALTLAKAKDQSRMMVWLEKYGVTDALVVFIRDNKVNITAIGAEKTSQVSYAVSASDEEKRRAIEKAQAEVAEKQQLKKEDLSGRERFAIHFGGVAGKGMLSSGERMGILTGAQLHVSIKLWSFLQPQLHIDGYYGLQNGDFSSLLGGTAAGGLGYTFGSQKFAITPYAAGGIFAAQVKTVNGDFRVVLPTAVGGLALSYFFGGNFGLSINTGAGYVIDSAAPALFITGSLATVVRF